jgi:bacteriorhodopsin
MGLSSTVLWVVFAIMAGSTGFFYFLAVPRPSNQRAFHYITGAITMIAAISCTFAARGLMQV